jgi:glucokinase
MRRTDESRGRRGLAAQHRQWRAFPLRRSLRDALGVDVYVDGDARALALAEGAFGAARDDSSYLSMVVSTGVGGGLVIDGELLDGESGNAGHIGHLNVVPNGNCVRAVRSDVSKPRHPVGRSKRVTGRNPAEADAATRSSNRGPRRSSRRLTRVGPRFQPLLYRRIGGARFRRRVLRRRQQIGAGHGSPALLRTSRDRRSELGTDGPLLGAALVAWRARP